MAAPRGCVLGSEASERPYFAITSRARREQLYRLRFADPANPAAGGTVDQLLNGTETGGTAERLHMLDNITVDARGNVMCRRSRHSRISLASGGTTSSATRSRRSRRSTRRCSARERRTRHAGRGVVGNRRRARHPRSGLVPAGRAGAQDRYRSGARRVWAAARAVRPRRRRLGRRGRHRRRRLT